MINKHKQVVCDQTHIILNDNITIVPGYLEVKKRKVYKHYSDDPNNDLNREELVGKLRKAGLDEEDIEEECDKYMIINRSKYIRTAIVGEVEDDSLNGKHFINYQRLEEYVTGLK